MSDPEKTGSPATPPPRTVRHDEVAAVTNVQGGDITPATSARALDDMYDVYKQSAGVDISAAEAKRVLRKIDKRIVPILVGTYALQYLDKNSINFASVYGLKEGTGLQGQDYSWLGEFVV
jgi:hypothetical protein